ncbi:MAG TPA: hypothetical protein VF960_07105 [Chloroflexota bacterium]
MGNLISQDNGNRSGRKGGAPKYLQRFFLQRLNRLVSVRRERGPFLDPGDFDLHLLDKAVYSTYCDCLDLGVGDDARSILRNEFTTVEGGDSAERSAN